MDDCPQRSVVCSASTSGARYAVAVGDSANGIPRYTDCDEIREAALVATGNPDLDTTAITVAFDSGPGTPTFASCPAGGPTPLPEDIADRSRVVVSVKHSFEFLTPLARIFGGTATIESTERRTIFK